MRDSGALNTPEYQAKMRKWRAEWRERNPTYHRYHWIKRAYNLTPAQYEQMLLDQGGLCAICGDLMEKVNVDHDHETQEVRALLCTGCNTGIGALREDIVVMEKAIAYVLTHKELNELSGLL